jgi:hypothetical protein
MFLEASSGAEAGMPTPLSAATATAATTEAVALRTAAEATEAVRRGGQEADPEAATGLAGSPSVFALLSYIVFFLFGTVRKDFSKMSSLVCLPTIQQYSLIYAPYQNHSN